MEKALYADSYLINYKGMIMKFGALKGWIEMDSIDYQEVRPASYEECVRYSELHKEDQSE